MSVFVNNLDDFIAPSQACVNPLVKDKLDEDISKGESNTKSKKGAKISLEFTNLSTPNNFATKYGISFFVLTRSPEVTV